jgi:hypothetical protein
VLDPNFILDLKLAGTYIHENNKNSSAVQLYSLEFELPNKLQ